VNWDYRIDDLAVRELRDLGPSVARTVRDFLDKRIRGGPDPRAFGKPLRGGLHGLWSYRVEDCRLICELNDGELVVIVVKVGHRSTVYDQGQPQPRVQEPSSRTGEAVQIGHETKVHHPLP
jgi:mRNA interferase RelE/StbE